MRNHKIPHLLLFVSLILYGVFSAEYTYFVSPSGKGTNCTEKNPCTFTDCVSLFQMQGDDSNTVIFFDGVYEIEETVTLFFAMSFLNFSAYHNTKAAVITGGPTLGDQNDVFPLFMCMDECNIHVKGLVFKDMNIPLFTFTSNATLSLTDSVFTDITLPDYTVPCLICFQGETSTVDFTMLRNVLQKNRFSTFALARRVQVLARFTSDSDFIHDNILVDNFMHFVSTDKEAPLGKFMVKNITYINNKFLKDVLVTAFGNGLARRGLGRNENEAVVATFEDISCVQNTISEAFFVSAYGAWEIARLKFSDNTLGKGASDIIGSALFFRISDFPKFQISVHDSIFDTNDAQGSMVVATVSEGGTLCTDEVADCLVKLENVQFTSNQVQWVGPDNDGGGLVRTLMSSSVLESGISALASMKNVVFKENTLGTTDPKQMIGGGCLLASNFNLALDSCSFTDTTLEHGDGGAVYATYAWESRVSLANCEFTGNSASGSGGALYIDGVSEFMLRNSTVVANNVVTSGHGGGVLVKASHLSGVTGRFVFDDTSKIINNEAQGGFGGGVLLDNDVVKSTISVASLISNNTAKIHGGGLYYTSGKAVECENCEKNKPDEVLGAPVKVLPPAKQSVCHRMHKIINATNFDCTVEALAGFEDAGGQDVGTEIFSPTKLTMGLTLKYQHDYWHHEYPPTIDLTDFEKPLEFKLMNCTECLLVSSGTMSVAIGDNDPVTFKIAIKNT